MNKLPENEYYICKIGESDEYKRQVYQIHNKETGVLEFETSLLPQLHTVFTQLSETLDFIFNPEEGEVEKAEDNVVRLFPPTH